MPSRFTLAIVAAALSISPVSAQVRGTGAAGIRHKRRLCWDQARRKRVIGGRVSGTRHGWWFPRASIRGVASGRGALLFPYPYFYSDSDAGYDSQPAAQPQVIVVPASTPAPPPAPPAAARVIADRVAGRSLCAHHHVREGRVRRTDRARLLGEIRRVFACGRTIGAGK